MFSKKNILDCRFPFIVKYCKLEVHWLGSGVQTGATKKRPTTAREKKIMIEVYGEEKKLLERP